MTTLRLLLSVVSSRSEVENWNHLKPRGFMAKVAGTSFQEIRV